MHIIDVVDLSIAKISSCVWWSEWPEPRLFVLQYPARANTPLQNVQLVLETKDGVERRVSIGNLDSRSKFDFIEVTLQSEAFRVKKVNALSKLHVIEAFSSKKNWIRLPKQKSNQSHIIR